MGSHCPGMASSASAVNTAVPASSTGMPAAISAPNTAISRISVIGTEVSSACRKSWLTIALAARSALASPASAISRPGWRACTPATARSAGTTVWSSWLTWPGTVKVTRALRPSAETSPVWPAPNGVAMSRAECGTAASAAATCWAARRMAGSARYVRPGPPLPRGWISTYSCGGVVKPSRCRVCSATPDWPASLDGRFFDGNWWHATKMTATSRNQPNTTVFRCRALHPAIRSTTGARDRCGCSRTGPVSGNTELDGWRIMAFSLRAVRESVAVPHP